MNISGDRIYKGSSAWGAPVASVSGEYVYEGVGGLLSVPLATISCEYVYEAAAPGACRSPLSRVAAG
jgi:hypothetical protein